MGEIAQYLSNYPWRIESSLRERRPNASAFCVVATAHASRKIKVGVCVCVCVRELGSHMMAMS